MKKKQSKNKEDQKHPPRLPAATMEDEETSRALFLEAMEQLNRKNPPDKDALRGKTPTGGPSGRAAQAASPPKSIDLHGLTLAEAENFLRCRLDAVLRELTGEITLTIITGKGKHSGPGGSVLASGIHRFIRIEYEEAIVYLQESPADVLLGGLPLRGHFRVTLKRTRSIPSI